MLDEDIDWSAGMQEWIDEFLVWNPADFDGVEKIVVSSKRMWVPKLATGNRSVRFHY